MKMSQTGRKLLEQREGNILHAYKDSVGIWTIGYGHTHFDGDPIPAAGMKITQQEADDMLTRDLVRYEDIVNDNVEISLEQHEFDALVSLCYNVEAALSYKSSVVIALNNEDKPAAAKAILLYNRPPEIMGRRRQEHNQFLTPYKDNK
jgi:lysozyme